MYELPAHAAAAAARRVWRRAAAGRTGTLIRAGAALPLESDLASLDKVSMCQATTDAEAAVAPKPRRTNRLRTDSSTCEVGVLRSSAGTCGPVIRR